MLTKRRFLVSSMTALTGTAFAGLPAFASRDDHPYGDHPLNNMPFTFWLGGKRIELILPFFPELDPDGYPVGEGRVSYAANGNNMTSTLTFAADGLRNFGDVLIKGGDLAIEIADQKMAAHVDMNNAAMKYIKLTGAMKDDARLVPAERGIEDAQVLSAGAQRQRWQGRPPGSARSRGRR